MEESSKNEIEGVFTARYDTPYLSIIESLIGRDHQFKYEGYSVTLTLPQEDLAEVISRSPGLKTRKAELKPTDTRK